MNSLLTLGHPALGQVQLSHFCANLAQIEIQFLEDTNAFYDGHCRIGNTFYRASCPTARTGFPLSLRFRTIFPDPGTDLILSDRIRMLLKF